MRWLIGLVLLLNVTAPASADDGGELGRRLEFSTSIGYARQSPSPVGSSWCGCPVVGAGVGYAVSPDVRLEMRGGYRMIEKQELVPFVGMPQAMVQRLFSLTLGASFASRVGDMAPFMSAGVGGYSFQTRYEPSSSPSTWVVRPGATLAFGVRGASEGLSPRLEARLHALPSEGDGRRPLQFYELSVGLQFR